MKTWDAVDIAWVAGIIEGEGCINIRRPANKYPLAVCTVAMTDFDIIRRLHEVTGIGRVNGKRVDKRGSNRKPTLSWTVAKQRDLARLLLAIAPLMGERRRGKILKAAETLAPGAPSHAIQHGTRKGYDQERRRGLKTCGQCRAAYAESIREYHREYNKTDKARAYQRSYYAEHYATGNASAERTECPKGHPYDEENTRVYNGRRHCRACDRMRPSRYKKRQRPVEVPTQGA